MTRRRVTFSRNVTLSLSRTCRCHCKYCAFATHQAHLHEPEEVERLIDGAARRGVKELLVLTGEAPRSPPGVRERSTRSASPTSPPTSCGRASARSSAACCRTRTSASLEPRRARAAARGHRVAGADARVGQPRPGRPPGLADQAPGRCGSPRSATARGAADPVHERDPGRHRRVRGGPDGGARGAGGLRAPAGGDPAELRPAPALLRRGAGRDRDRGGGAYWRTGLHDGPAPRRARVGDAGRRSRT